MIVVGLVGGIGSGKSTVANLFVELGATTIDADKIGHEILRKREVLDAVREEWGKSVFDENGWIERRELAKIVFSNSPDGKQSLARLEAITHPHIHDELASQLELFRQQHVPIAVLDAPVLLKAGWHLLCDHLVFVDCPLDQRIARVASRGWDASELQRREDSQWPLADKRAACDLVVDNSQGVQRTHLQVNQLVDSWARGRSQD